MKNEQIFAFIVCAFLFIGCRTDKDVETAITLELKRMNTVMKGLAEITLRNHDIENIEKLISDYSSGLCLESSGSSVEMVVYKVNPDLNQWKHFTDVSNEELAIYCDSVDAGIPGRRFFFGHRFGGRGILKLQHEPEYNAGAAVSLRIPRNTTP